MNIKEMKEIIYSELIESAAQAVTQTDWERALKIEHSLGMLEALLDAYEKEYLLK